MKFSPGKLPLASGRIWPSRDWVLWLPFAGLCAETGREALLYGPALDLWMLLLAAWLVAAWLLGRGLFSAALLTALLLTPLSWLVLVRAPEVGWALQNLPAEIEVRVEGVVRKRANGAVRKRENGAVRMGAAAGETEAPAAPKGVFLLLGDASLWLPDGARNLAEVEVTLPRGSPWAFPQGSRVRIGGVLRRWRKGGDAGAEADPRHPLRLVFRNAAHYRISPPVTPWTGEALRLRLRDRAAYYLSKPALAVYLPIVLGMHARSGPEARQVTGAFRRVGIAHLFAISGLHVGLIYLLFAGLIRWGRWVWCTVTGMGGVVGALVGGGQGWAHTPAAIRLGALAAIWAYIALIGFPLPAVRAALMGALLIANQLWGTRTSPLYVLWLAALVLLAWEPSQFHGLSFQMSFLAYFFLLCALQSWPPLGTGTVTYGAGRSTRDSAWAQRGLRLLGHLGGKISRGVLLNLWMTGFITLGLWPLTLTTFGRISLLVFAGNLVMVPLMAVLVLPAGLAGLTLSVLNLGAPPGGWLESWVFGGLEAVLTWWIWLVQALERAGEGLIFESGFQGGPWLFLGYYALLILATVWLIRLRKTALQPRQENQGGGVGQKA